MARTLARQLPRAFAFASTSKREGSPRAVTGLSAQVAADAGSPVARAASTAAVTTRAWRRGAGMLASSVVEWRPGRYDFPDAAHSPATAPGVEHVMSVSDEVLKRLAMLATPTLANALDDV